ncbi:hypothetical protein GCM10010172_53390 [Paractinoplanes ferrugineus]|uniref:Uncharacterized protein n=1 Tax=Paractinoplanes ferrugineus TaxID=113564 RepID=A0A919J0V1_9ACTN|nr:hypothetical protein [Actinoplanes ferrugineus]GIE11843.1 hypothetical protein Afe05nite_36830 [Actinoplanes ferrugineus]
MSRQFRYRSTALVLGGLIVGAPLLLAGTASAEQLGPVGRQVTFGGGGIMGFSCRSHPDVESLVVPAKSKVRLINRTGYSARLLLAGKSKGTLPDDSFTEVVFRRGTTSVTLKPNCPVGEDVAPLMVTASPSAAAAPPKPSPEPTGDHSSSAAAVSAGSPDAPTRPGAGTKRSDSAPAKRPRTTIAGHGGVRKPRLRTSSVARAATTEVQAMPQGGNAPKIKTKRPDGTAGSPTPTFAGMPPGDEKALLPGVPQLDPAPTAQEAAPTANSPTPAEVAAAEPVATMEPMPESGPIGLLGLIAAVCVLGVGTATIRAIVSRRANRANMA